MTISINIMFSWSSIILYTLCWNECQLYFDSCLTLHKKVKVCIGENFNPVPDKDPNLYQ